MRGYFGCNVIYYWFANHKSAMSAWGSDVTGCSHTGTFQGALVDTLQDGCRPEEREGHVQLPVIYAAQSHGPGILAEDFLCWGDAHFSQVTLANP